MRSSGAPEEAAALAGAALGLLTSGGRILSAFERQVYDRVLSSIREHLGEAAASAAISHGRAASLDDLLRHTGRT